MDIQPDHKITAATNEDHAYRQCSHCVLDTNDDPGIRFDEQGVCNHCHGYEAQLSRLQLTGEAAEKKLTAIVDRIKSEGKNKPYDCLIGVSGGVDSTYLAYHVKRLGLRPLAVHFDNGWNSELAVMNVENVVKKLGFDLYTYVINWEEFKDLQLSFLKASVVDIEMTSDHAINATLYRIARKHGIKYLLSGFNIVTEGILPKNWRWDKSDWRNIKAIHRKYGSVPLKTFPHLGFIQGIFYEKFFRMHRIRLFDYIPFINAEVKKIITEELGWRDYGGKHYESIITRFYQGYILPVKFNIDKRKGHLASLVCAGQLTREEALEALKQPIYDPEQLRTDKAFVLKKFGLSEEEFEAIMQEPPRSHLDFPSFETVEYVYHRKIFGILSPVLNLFRGKK